MSVHNEAKSLHCRTHIVAVCLLFGVFFYSFYFYFLSSRVVCLFRSSVLFVCQRGVCTTCPSMRHTTVSHTLQFMHKSGSLQRIYQ